MTVSLVICTRNRAAQLPACLASVAQMERPAGFELVLVDNGSTDGTAAAIAAFAATADFKVTCVAEPVPGLGRARNAGWQAASGDVVAFTDDDCHVAPDLAARLADHFAAEPDLAFYGGRIELHDPADLPITILTHPHRRDFPAGKLVRPGRIQGANFGARRAVLLASGGFDERLGAGTHFPSEDAEFVARLAATGHRGAYLPDLVVSHAHGRRTGEELARLVRSYQRGAGAFYVLMARYPAMRLPLLAAMLRRAARDPSGIMHEWRAAREFRQIYGADLVSRPLSQPSA